MTDIQWKPVSEMPSDLKLAFLHKHGNPSRIIARKGGDGKWRGAFGLFDVEIVGVEDMYFIPLDVIPELPA